MRTTSVAVCIGVRVRGCACATPGVIVTAAVTLTATFYYYCCFIAAATVFFLLVNKQLCIMNILKYKIILSVSAELPAPPY